LDGTPEQIQTNSFVEFEIKDGPDEASNKKFRLRSGDSIGRKQTNIVCFQDDLHMSNLHCKINQIQDIFLFEDIASTNGSWLRLSDENRESEFYPLKEQLTFKIGNSAMYEVQKVHGDNTPVQQDSNSSLQKSTPSNNLCCICWSADRDVLIQPCRHIVSCAKCIKNQRNCPVCRTPIHDLIIFYKA
jgi:hypothetical protein